MHQGVQSTDQTINNAFIAKLVVACILFSDFKLRVSVIAAYTSELAISHFTIANDLDPKPPPKWRFHSNNI